MFTELLNFLWIAFWPWGLIVVLSISIVLYRGERDGCTECYRELERELKEVKQNLAREESRHIRTAEESRAELRRLNDSIYSMKMEHEKEIEFLTSAPLSDLLVTKEGA